MYKTVKVLKRPFEKRGYLNDKHFKNLDGIRGIAILFVIIAHQQFTDEIPIKLKNVIQLLFQDGKLGVGIFFVLSGFLITSLLIKEFIKNGTIRLKAFYLRRVLRIAPGYLFFIGTVSILNCVYEMQISWLTFTGVILYLNNFNLFPNTVVFTHTWSLAVEEQYYLCWPFIFKTLKEHLILICLILVLINPLLRILVYKMPSFTNIILSPFLNFAEPIIVGSLFAILNAKGVIKPIKSTKTLHLIVIFSFLIFWLCYYLSYKGRLGLILLPFGTTISEFAIGLCIFLLCSQNSSTILEVKWLIFIGKISYSLYLWQQLFIFGEKAYGFKAIWTIFPLNIIGIFTAAIFSYYLIETPFLKLKKRFSAIN